MTAPEPHIEFSEGSACAALAAEMHRHCFTSSWDEASFRSAMEIPGSIFELLSLGPNPAAFALYRQMSEEAELLTLGVLPDFRRQGYAALLLLHGMRFLKSRGSKFLFLEVGEKNAGAIHLYKTAEFIEIGRRKNYYHHAGGREDAIVMERNLQTT